jgi:hypothetical protein
MGDVEDTYAAFAEAEGLSLAEGFQPGAVTPLLAKGGSLRPAAAGELAPGIAGTIARFHYAGEGGAGFTYQVVFAEIPESQGYVPRLQCERTGRLTDAVHYGFEMRSSRLWTESEVLNERYRVSVSPFQDDNWMRQLFIPTFIDYLAHTPPADFSFELAYGSLLCSIEEDDPRVEGLGALWACAATVARRIREESSE